VIEVTVYEVLWEGGMRRCRRGWWLNVEYWIFNIETVGISIVCLELFDWEQIASYGNVSVGESWVSSNRQSTTIHLPQSFWIHDSHPWMFCQHWLEISSYTENISWISPFFTSSHSHLVFEGLVRLQSQPLLAATATTTGCLTYKNSPTMTTTVANQSVTSCCGFQLVLTSHNLYMYINL